MVGFWIFILIYFILSICVSFGMAEIAKMKGHDGGVAGILCFIFGIFGYMYVIALPDKVLREQNQKIIELLSSRPVNNAITTTSNTTNDNNAINKVSVTVSNDDDLPIM